MALTMDDVVMISPPLYGYMHRPSRLPIIIRAGSQNIQISRSIRYTITHYCIYTNTFHRLNISKGPVQERPLTTGLHVVCDVYCQCERYVGWFYVSNCW